MGPITLFIRNRLKYALSAKEVQTILKQRLVKIDGQVRTDPKFPTGFMDVVQVRNTGRVGTIMHRERHPGSFDIVHVKDANGHTFATRLAYIFVIGKGNKPYISLPKGAGIKLSTAEERDKRLQRS